MIVLETKVYDFKLGSYKYKLVFWTESCSILPLPIFLTFASYFHRCGKGRPIGFEPKFHQTFPHE